MDEHARTRGPAETVDALLTEILPNVGYAGWSDSAFFAAVEAVGISKSEARAVCPNRAIDLALAFHQRGDDQMAERLGNANLSQLRFREQVALALRFRFEVVAENRLAVRRAASLFALPLNSRHGSAAIWKTSDRIWNCLGDTSGDINWYTKRLSLSAVYGASILYWLGDSSFETAATWSFIDRRIDDVMKIEGIKAQARNNPTCGGLMRGLDAVGRKFRPPPDRSRYPGWHR